MSDELVIPSLQDAELDRAFERNGFTAADVKLLLSGSILSQLLPVLRGQAEFSIVKHFIDCDTDPLIPRGDWKVEEHKKCGQVEWDPSQFTLHLSPHQKDGKTILGHKLRKELSGLPTPNANLLDYLLDHPHLIPGEWKRDENGNIRYIFFWGTIYRDSEDHLHVRCLCYDAGHWQGYCGCLGHVFDGFNLSVVCAS